ncbi:MAG TPA: hypothetical protein VFP71_09475 [Candidatus Angelobacter sp.]|nr:hypothetical protein [Candidatus Angelobacter sp.]
MGYWSKNSEWLRSVKEMSLILRCLALTALAFILPAQTTSSAIAKPYYEDPEGYEIYAALLAAPNPNKGGSDLAVILQRTLVFENCYKPDEQWRELLAPVLENYEKMNQTRWNLADSLFRFPHKLISADEEYALFAKGTKNGWKQFHRKYPHKALLSVSAVGFNREKTIAMVATESDCGPLCGSGGISFLRKTDGMWKEFHPTGTICVVVH